MSRAKILFVAAHRPGRSPSQRFRYEQYLPWLRQQGFICDVAPLLDADDDRVFYSAGNIPGKAKLFFKSFRKRSADAKRAAGYDLIFIQREAFMTGSTRFERRMKASGAVMIYDFDDAIWLLDISEGNKIFSWLKKPGKTSRLIALSDFVIAGNSYLASYAKQFNSNVFIIPSTISMDEYRRVDYPATDVVNIGWSGSHTTIKHFESALPVLLALKNKFGSRIRFSVMGDPAYENAELGIKGIPWSEQSEVPELSRFDIGIMPLPDNEWAKGKCGMKGLQYMALGIPTVMAAVGVNSEIIRDGENGYLASSENEWIEKISALIESAELRKKIGEAGKQTVAENYSLQSQREKLVNILREALNTKK